MVFRIRVSMPTLYRRATHFIWFSTSSPRFHRTTWQGTLVAAPAGHGFSVLDRTLARVARAVPRAYDRAMTAARPFPVLPIVLGTVLAFLAAFAIGIAAKKSTGVAAPQQASAVASPTQS